MTKTVDEIKAAIAPYLTLENARIYAAKTDKYVWVIDNILDCADVPATERNVNYVEDAFDLLIAEAGNA